MREIGPLEVTGRASSLVSLVEGSKQCIGGQWYVVADVQQISQGVYQYDLIPTEEPIDDLSVTSLDNAAGIATIGEKCQRMESIESRSNTYAESDEHPTQSGNHGMSTQS